MHDSELRKSQSSWTWLQVVVWPQRSWEWGISLSQTSDSFDEITKPVGCRLVSWKISSSIAVFSGVPLDEESILAALEYLDATSYCISWKNTGKSNQMQIGRMQITKKNYRLWDPVSRSVRVGRTLRARRKTAIKITWLCYVTPVSRRKVSRKSICTL